MINLNLPLGKSQWRATGAGKKRLQEIICEMKEAAYINTPTEVAAVCCNATNKMMVFWKKVDIKYNTIPRVICWTQGFIRT